MPDAGTGSSLREKLERPSAFVVAAEIVTSRGLLSADGGRKALELASELAEDPRIDVLSITDNPGGHAMFSPDALGTGRLNSHSRVCMSVAKNSGVRPARSTAFRFAPLSIRYDARS